MNILVTAFAYNEIKHIPNMVEYYKRQGCDLFILDNMSYDGTYEWLVENNVPNMRVDTQDSFHIDIMQKALLEKLKELNPDWLIYTGIDTFFIFPERINEIINKAEENKFNTISCKLLEIFNTGEQSSIPFYKTYFYGKFIENREMIVKYHKDLHIVADRLVIPDRNTYNSDGILINYGMCKSKEEREETLKRRKKAWELGLSRGYGTHYLSSQKIDWKWERDKLTDVRTINAWTMIKKQLYEN